MNNQFPNSPFTKTGSAPSAPPPPSEVKIRTMRSDLASMTKSGGGLPRFESVKMENLSMGAPASRPSASPGSKKGLIMFLVVIAAFAMLGAGAFFVYRVYIGSSFSFMQPSAQAPGSPAAGGQSAGMAAKPSMALPPFTHASFFKKKPAGQTLALTLSTGGSASSATDLQTFNQKLMAVLARASTTSAMIEVAMQKADGNGVAASDFLSQANIPFLDPAFLAAHFNPDETFFVYRDKSGGYWPGVVFSLKPGEDELFVKSSAAKIESSPAAIENFFPVYAGAPSPDGFTDSVVANTSVRILSFLASDSAAYFTYGWDKTYLILSTSQKGFAEAVARLP